VSAAIPAARASRAHANHACQRGAAASRLDVSHRHPRHVEHVAPAAGARSHTDRGGRHDVLISPTGIVAALDPATEPSAALRRGRESHRGYGDFASPRVSSGGQPLNRWKRVRHRIFAATIDARSSLSTPQRESRAELRAGASSICEGLRATARRISVLRGDSPPPSWRPRHHGLGGPDNTNLAPASGEVAHSMRGTGCSSGRSIPYPRLNRSGLHDWQNAPPGSSALPTSGP